MKRLFGLILVALCILGCKSEAPVCDPFGGRTTIPPPSTGASIGRPVEPCYQPPPLVPNQQTPGGCCPPTVQLPSAATSTAPAALQPSPQPTGSSWTNPPGALAAPTGQPAASPSNLTPNALAPRPYSAGPAYTTPSNTPAPRYSTPGAAPYSNPGPMPNAGGAAPVSPGNNPGTAPSGNQYAPPGGYIYRGASTTGAPAVSPSVTSVGVARSSMVGDDRMPRPVDDAASAALRKPIISTLQPRGQEGVADRPVDIADLPKAP